MNGNIFARLTGSQRTLLAVLASSAIFTSGCANMATTATGANSFNASATLSGRVHGGNQPVSGAAVSLYYAGQSTPAVLAATTTTANDGTGSFSFTKSATPGLPPNGNTFSCPVAGNPLVYVVAHGGNTLNDGNVANSNSAAAFIAIYGDCANLSAANVVDMTEVTTVATMAAVQQYFDPATDSLVADGTGVAKIAIDYTPTTISHMVNAATGTAVTSTVISPNSSGGVGVAGVKITATPESSKINLLANIISACVNNASSTAGPCTTLFANAVPPDPTTTSRPIHTVFSPATDVLQALYYMLTNPTDGSVAHLTNLFNLAGGVGAPYQPALSAAPSDWTVGITYSTNDTCGIGGGFINGPSDINVDQFGNVWIANSQSGVGNLTQIYANGAPNTCVFIGGGSKGGAVLDYKGNVWLASAESNQIVRYSQTLFTGLGFATPEPTLGVTADGVGNVFFTGAVTGFLYEIPNGANLTTAIAPIQVSTVTGPTPIRLMPDTTGAIWVSSGGPFVSRVVPGVLGDPNYINGFSTTTFPVAGPTYGVSVTALNQVFVSTGGASGSVSYLTGSGTSYSVANGWPTAAGQGGINNPTALVSDSAQNVWTPNLSPNTGTAGLYSLSEISLGENSLSPDGTVAGGFQKSASYLKQSRAMVVDQSGNVWVAGDGNNFVTEIVGASVPVYQPYSLGLANGRFQKIP